MLNSKKHLLLIILLNSPVHWFIVYYFVTKIFGTTLPFVPFPLKSFSDFEKNKIKSEVADYM